MPPGTGLGTWIAGHLGPGFKKPCRAAQWQNERLAARTSSVVTPPWPWPFNDVAMGLAPDGAGGAYILSAWTHWQFPTTGPFHLCHFTELGVRNAAIQFGDARAWIGVAAYCSEAAVVQGPNGHCYMAWAHDWDTDDLRVQRFDASLAAQWAAPVIASASYPSYFRSSSLVAEHDCNGGILLAWRQWQANAPTHEIRAQRVDQNGNLLWGPNGVVVATTSLTPDTPFTTVRPLPAWLQLVERSNGGAYVLWQEPTRGSRVDILMQSISPNGVVGTKPPRVIAGGRDADWRAVTRLRRAVRTIADSFILAFADLQGHLQCLQHSPNPQFAWQEDLGPLAHRHGFHVEADAGNAQAQVGAQIAQAVAGGFVVHRQDYNAPGPVTSSLLPANHPSSLAPADAWARSAHCLPFMVHSGSIIVFQDWQAGGARLKTKCIDYTGPSEGAIQDLTSGGLSQDLPLGVPTGLPTTGGSAMVAWSDGFPGGVDGQDVWAQRVGCCLAFDPTGIDIGPELPCAIVEAPGLPWGQFAVDLPCGNRGRQFGLLPLSRLARTVRGLAVPGIFNNRAAKAPDWVRIQFRGLPKGITVTLVTARGKPTADAEPLGEGEQQISALTFRPSPTQDFVLVFHRPKSDRTRLPVSVGVDVEWGAGKAPPPRPEAKPTVASA